MIEDFIYRELKRFGVFVALLLSFSINAQVALTSMDGHWTFTIDGETFDVKGVTFGYDKDVENYTHYFRELQDMGVNAIRTWATSDETGVLLDAAQEYGIKVMLGIWMRHGRPGMEDDDHFDYLNDRAGMQVMYQNAIKAVNQYKDHPALLTWGVGNEVYLNIATDEEKEAYSHFLEKVCSQIKKMDPNHPITSVDAWTFGLDWWSEFVPSIDIYGLNCYGAGANLLNDEIEKRGLKKPYLITEFGVTGEWDIKTSNQGIKKEPSDSEKYEAIVKGYKDWIVNKPANLGVFIFHYASDDTFISPWLLTHYKGKKRPQYWAIKEAYTSKIPLNFVPEISSLQVRSSSYKSGQWLPVNLEVMDREGEELKVSFAYNQRSGSRKRRDQILPLPSRGNLLDGFEILAPKEDGPVKLYAIVEDEFGNAGIESTVLLVEDEDRRKVEFLVPKVDLPFYVYEEGKQEQPFVASAYMGNYQKMKVDVNCTETSHSGDSSIKISYEDWHNWYGIALVDPANDWGDILGGYEVSGAEEFSFWAKADQDKVKVSVGYGLIGKDKKFPDSSKKSKEIKLSKKWKRFSINVKEEDLSVLRSGFVLFSTGNAFPHSIYVDDIVFK
jgi:hypothetical protein